jgi:predicted outer membrane lipoprotein
MIKFMVIVALVMIAAGAIFFRSTEAFPFALGVFLTTALNVLKAVWLEHTVNRVAEMEEGQAGSNLVRLQYLLRFLLTGLVMVAAVYLPFIHLWGAVAGIFTFPISAHLLRFTIPKQESK